MPYLPVKMDSKSSLGDVFFGREFNYKEEKFLK